MPLQLPFTTHFASVFSEVTGLWSAVAQQGNGSHGCTTFVVVIWLRTVRSAVSVSQKVVSFPLKQVARWGGRRRFRSQNAAEDALPHERPHTEERRERDAGAEG